MRRLSLLLSLMVLVPAAAARAQDDVGTALTKREADMWRYVKEKNGQAFRASVDTTLYSGIYYDGRRGSNLDVASYHWVDLERYDLSEMRAQAIDSSNVLVTYKAVLKGRATGVPVQGPYWMATLWHLRDGQWLAVFHSEVKGPR